MGAKLIQTERGGIQDFTIESCHFAELIPDQHGLFSVLFRLNGKFLFAMGATAKHCAFYLGSTVQAFKDDLEQYDTSNGTIRFQANKPLPTTLVRKLVKARVTEQSAH